MVSRDDVRPALISTTAATTICRGDEQHAASARWKASAMIPKKDEGHSGPGRYSDAGDLFSGKTPQAMPLATIARKGPEAATG